jgi:membrane protein YdbS with pleckstrin-like domain
VQSVDLNRPLIARLFGLTELRVEVADAGESVLRLAYLPAIKAEHLRAEVLRRAAGARSAHAGGASLPDDAGQASAPSGGEGAPMAEGTPQGLAPQPQGRDGAPGDDVTGPADPAHRVEAGHSADAGVSAGPGGPGGVVGTAGATDQPAAADRAAADLAAAGTQPHGVGHGTSPRLSAKALAERAQEWGRRTGDDFAGQAAYGRFAGGTDDEVPLVEIPMNRLMGSIALSVAPWVVVSLAGVIVLAISAPGAAFVGVLIPAVLGIGSAAWQHLNSCFGFRAAVSADGLRVRHGLTNTQHRTVPRGRVQAIGIKRPLLYRPFGWVVVQADVAGYGSKDQKGDAGRSTLLPVGTLTEAARIVSTLIPDAGTEDPWGLLEEGLDGRGGSFVRSPSSARWISPIGWKRQGFLATDTTLVIRSGRISRRLALIPHARTQAVRSYQGPVSRVLGLAKVRFCTVSGPISTSLPDVAAGVAGDLVVAQTARIVHAARLEAGAGEVSK